MSLLPPLAMSQTKDDLLRHVDIDPETYSLMAKETDAVYKWLTSDKHHLKKNCKRKPPYDWSDVVEKSKDEAMTRIISSGDPRTSYYWNLAAPTEDCPNWIARWFLYHKFRYRDGRNKNAVKGGDGKQARGSSSRPSDSHHRHGGGVEAESNGYYDGTPASYYPTAAMSDGQDPQGYGYPATASSSTGNDYPNGYPPYGQTYYSSTKAYKQEGQEGQEDGQALKTYWDPVRDV